ncbi:MAG: PTS mannitol transporter subunit IICBA [Defluviitaleaceae bacterium]|nr:PTS mannitol transporter subunit IICBA [Defluviitaleaceae bacterium]
MENAKLFAQRFGRSLSAMVMPNIGAFIAWGFITALFIPTGWIPNENFATLVGPMITYLLPLLIGYTGGKMIAGVRGGVMGSIVTMGVIVGTDIPMFLGAMMMGPLGGYVIAKFDNAIDGKIKPGFEMLVNNFSIGILGTGFALLAYAFIGPIVLFLNEILSSGVNVIVNAGLLPLASIIIEPAKILFLNNALNHGVLGPIGFLQAEEAGRSIMFLLETNPGPGLGILLAYSVFAKGGIKASAPGAIIIHFFGGIHEIYFPYVLMKPVLLLAVIGGGAAGILTFVLTGVGLVATPAPGSIFALMLMTPAGNHFGVLAGVVVSTVVTFLIAAMFVRGSNLTMESLETSKEQTVALKGIHGAKNIDETTLVVFACDAGMGSSAMGASMLSKNLKTQGLNITVKNYAINEIPSAAQIVVTHNQLTSRAKERLPGAVHISVSDFMSKDITSQVLDKLSQNAATEVFSPQNILLGQKAADKFEAITMVGELMVKNNIATDAYTRSMLEREKSISTYMGAGIAIPHGTSQGREHVLKTGIVFVQFKDGIDFDGKTAYALIGIASTDDNHLETISKLAGIVSENKGIEAVLKSDDVDLIYKTFSA